MYTSAQGDVSVTDVTTAFKSKYPSVELADVFGEDSDYDVGRLLAQEFVEKAGITSLPQVMIALVKCRSSISLTLYTDTYKYFIIYLFNI